MGCARMSRRQREVEADIALEKNRTREEVHAAMHAALTSGPATTVDGAQAFVRLTLPARPIEDRATLEAIAFRESLERSAGAGLLPARLPHRKELR